MWAFLLYKVYYFFQILTFDIFLRYNIPSECEFSLLPRRKSRQNPRRTFPNLTPPQGGVLGKGFVSESASWRIVNLNTNGIIIWGGIEHSLIQKIWRSPCRPYLEYSALTLPLIFAIFYSNYAFISSRLKYSSFRDLAL